MKRLYLLPALLALGGFLLFGAGKANADACVKETGSAQVNFSNPLYPVRFGAWIKLFSQTHGDAGKHCDTYLTEVTSGLSGENSESANTSSTDKTTYNSGLANEYALDQEARASASASFSNVSVTSSVYEFNGGSTVSKSSAELIDLVMIENLGADATDVNNIPVEFCSDLSSKYTTHGVDKSSLFYGDYTYNGESRVYDSLTITGGNYISHATNGKICRDGILKMTGKYVYFSLKLETYTLGNQVIEIVPTYGGNVTGVYASDGSITASFKLGALPSGATCYSASGSFAGCERKLPDKVLACNANGGNPINFALGVKHQTESDYSGGLLSLSRLYRSDATSETGMFGENWRHNFDRDANIIVTPESTTVGLTDTGGATTVFRKDLTAGTWATTSEGVTATFADVLDGSQNLIGYVHTTTNDTREYYGLDGHITRIEYRGGQALDFTHDTSDRLATVTDEQGKSLTFNYNSSDQITSVVTPSGTYSYSYDTNNNLSVVTKPDTKTRTYHYEDTIYVNALTGITDEKGIRFATWTYDTEGRPTSSEHAGGVDSFTVAYNADGTVTTTNALGKDTIYTFQTINGVPMVTNVDGVASANCQAASRTTRYDAQGFVESKTDWKGNTTTYQRDANGLVTSRTDDAYGSAARTTTTTYDANYRLPDVITETGKTTDYDYDSDGRVTSITVTDTATGETRTTTYSYNANTTDSNGNVVLGKLASVDGSRTDVTDTTSYIYDSSGRLIKTTNALGHVSEILTFDSANRPLTTKDANGTITTFVYDALGRVISSTVGSSVTSYTYDANGNVLTVTLPNGVVTTNAYDDAGRLTSITDALGNSITYTLDNAGNITKEEYKDSASTLKYTASKVYDELSRVLDSVDANLDKVTNVYDVNGNVTSTTDGNFNATSFAFDGLDRLLSSTDALNGVTTNTINELDQTTDVNDPRSNTTSYTYNAFGDVTQEISPDRGIIDYTHDKAGNITSMNDGRGVVTNYTYDALNRLLTTSYPSDSSLNVTLTYDSVSGCGISKGQLCSVADASGTTSYIYDNLGRLTSVSEVRGSLTFTTAYGYDAAGVLTSITLPSGRVVTYGLNGNGQVSSVSAVINSTTTSLASSIAYLPFGGVTGLTYGNGLTLTNTHNTAYQLTNRSIGSMLNDSYTYDAAGNITVKGSTSYSYDALYRLTGENSDTYSYDAIANRLSDYVGGSTTSYSYPSTSSRLSSIGANSVTTDVSGNITADNQRSYTIDAAGHVAAVSISGSTVGSYIYNANNQRTSKTASSVTTHYVYGAGGLLYGEYDTSGNLIREYVYLNGQPLAQIDSGEVLSYLHTDHLGTPRYATNTAGVQVWNWSSDAFGNGTPTGSAAVNLRFTGQYWDNESSLHYNWNRYYDPATGRYISSDPIGLAGGLNTYGYALANPVMFTDPEGLIIWKGSIREASVKGAGAYSLVLQSPCYNNSRIIVKILAAGAEFGLGVSLKTRGIQFDDKRPDSALNPYVFQGSWRIIGIGVDFPPGMPGNPTNIGFGGQMVINGIRSTPLKLKGEKGGSLSGGFGGGGTTIDYVIDENCGCGAGV